MIEWAREMLDAAEAAPAGDARGAILARIGAVLLASHGVWIDSDEIPSANRRAEPSWQVSWTPKQETK